MTARKPVAPTPAELQVLRLLWSGGPQTVRQVHEALYSGTDTGYTTTLKLLQNLHGKRLVTRDAGQRQHQYAAAVAESEILGGVVQQLIDRAFDGSAAALAMQALADSRPTTAELAELKALIRQLEREG